MKIDYVATAEAHALLATIGRTEDLRLSPDNRRLAIAAFHRQQIALFDIHFDSSGSEARIELSNPRTLTSSHLQAPHGLDFIDEQHLLVANRKGQLCLFRLPEDSHAPIADAIPIDLPDRPFDSPGSLAVRRLDERLCEVWVCDNFVHRVVHLRLDYRSGYVEHRTAQLEKWLDVPDGVALNPHNQWLAVSNHNLQSVMLYGNPDSVQPSSDPQAILGGLHYPHGLRFSRSGRQLLVADAGAPYVHAYQTGVGGWQGVLMPCRSWQVVDTALFQREQKNPQEGGPKGIDLDNTQRFLAVTCSGMPLAFFDLGSQLQTDPPADCITPATPYSASQVHIELQRLQQNRSERQHAAGIVERAAEAEAWVQAMQRSRSWRLTAPLRWLAGRLRRSGATQ